MSETMKAVVKMEPVRGATLLEREMPSIQEDEVLVRIRGTSVCGTDVHIYTWDAWSSSRIGKGKLPQIMGHEACGEVVECGKRVRGLKTGDFVAIETHIPDPTDLQSWMGQAHIGEHMRIVGVDRHGTFADFVSVPETVCWRIDGKIPPEVASVMEPLGNATYAVLGEDNDVAGKTMAIVGDGPIGLFATAVARACGVTKIFLVGRWEFNLQLGKKLGADHILSADDATLDRVSYVRDHTRGFGADIVLEMAGVPQAINEGFAMLRKGGRFSAFGVSPGSETTLDYNNAIVFKGAQVHGINGRKMFDTWYRMENLLASGRLDITPVITHLFPLGDFEHGFDLMMEQPRRSAKIVLFPDPAEYEAAAARMGKAAEAVGRV
jgi:threonine 3-dehydrogenase